MADVAWTKMAMKGNADCWEVEFTATNKTTPILTLDPSKDTTIMIATTGAATVSVSLYAEDPENAGSKPFIFESAAATASGNDWIKSALGPVSGIDLTGTVAGGDTAHIQVMQCGSE